MYVDDLLVTGSNPESVEWFKRTMATEFEMTDLGKLSYFLGLEFAYTPAGLVMHQKKYIGEMLKRFNMSSCNAVANPMEVNQKLDRDESGEPVNETAFKQIIGSLRYLCNSIPELSFGVGLISRFMSSPKRSHMLAAKRVLRYIQGTPDHGVLFPFGKQDSEARIVGFADSDYGGDPVERKSTSGYIFLLNKAPVSWCSKKQSVVALSSCEAKYISGSFAACQAMWIAQLLYELKMIIKEPMELRIDNISAINLSKNPISHGRSKHIEIKFHFLRDLVSKGRIAVVHCRTEQQLADAMTKALKNDRFEELRKAIGVVSLKCLT